MALTDNLVSYWKLDESSGNAADAHASNTLTNNGSTAYAAAKINNGADLDGSNDYFSRAAQTWGVANEWSWQLWVKADSFVGNPRILFLSTGTSGSSFYNNVTFGIASTGSVFFQNYNSTGGTIKNATYGTLVISTWYHLVGTWDGTTMKLYVDGSEVTLTFDVNNSGTMTDTSRAWYIGATNSGTALYDGLLDEIGVWSRAITASEVTSLFNGGSGLAYPLTVSGTNTTNFFAMM